MIASQHNPLACSLYQLAYLASEAKIRARARLASGLSDSPITPVIPVSFGAVSSRADRARRDRVWRMWIGAPICVALAMLGWRYRDRTPMCGPSVDRRPDVAPMRAPIRIPRRYRTRRTFPVIAHPSRGYRVIAGRPTMARPMIKPAGAPAGTPRAMIMRARALGPSPVRRDGFEAQIVRLPMPGETRSPRVSLADLHTLATGPSRGTQPLTVRRTALR